jgi:hypothetical protein
LAQLDARRLHAVLLQIQAQVRGQPPPDELIAVDGKEPRHGPGDAILSTVTMPSQNSIWTAPWWTPRPAKSRWRANSLANSI